MPYIGKQPLTGAYQLCDTITTSATATYNLLVGGSAVIPGSANNCIVSLNGVVQAPVGAFTVSGSQITFASTLSSADVIDFILILGNVFDIGTPTNGAVTNSSLNSNVITGQTAETTVAGGDLVLIYDDSASALRKMTRTNFVGGTQEFAAGTAASPSITFTGDTNTGVFAPTADTIAFTEGGAEAMRIDSSGRVGIGTTDVNGLLNVVQASNTQALLRLRNNTADTSTADGMIFTITDSSAPVGSIEMVSGGSDAVLAFRTNGSERMRITSGGDVLVGQTANDASVKGIILAENGRIFATLNGPPARFNRITTDGNLVELAQDNTVEGTISVSGTTVSYNGFTGSHWSRFIDESKPDVLRGTVMESLDQMTDWYNAEFEVSTTEKDKDGNDVVKTTTQKKPYALKANEQEGDVITYAWNTEKKDEEGNDIIEQVQATIVKQVDVKHVMSKISDTVEAKNVYGVFSAWDNDDLINNDFYVASVGSFVVRIKAGQVVSKGDLLQSNGDGTAKVQADDIIRASTFAKVLSNTVIQTYEDGSFIVPCSLMC